MRKLLVLFMLFAAGVCRGAEKNMVIKSPDGTVETVVWFNGTVRYSVAVGGQEILTNSEAWMEIDGKKDNGAVKVAGTTSGKGEERIESPFYRVPAFTVSYCWGRMSLSNGISVEFRVFNDGSAYRFSYEGKANDEHIVNDEIVRFNFSEDYESYIPYSTNPKKPEAMAFQATYETGKLSSQPRDNLGFLPVAIDCHNERDNELKATLMESNLEAYPGMFVRTDGESLIGWFSKYPNSFNYYPWRCQKYVTSTEEYIAKYKGSRTFPWRIIALSHKDIEMPLNNLVYALASPNRIGDTSWIKPGMVAWDWWNDWGLTGVGFKAGINMDTYKYYIDFASEYGLPYVILDEGWYAPKSGDMLQTIEEIDLPALVEYARQRNVRLILWTVFNVLDKDLEAACKKYSDMGIAGFKVDFLDRDDQEGVEMIYRIADACARHKLVLDYHGIYKPTGINRTYPNIINFESVFGMEEAKWTKHDEKDMPLYDVTFPFIRMQTGFVDFTPGGMRNATSKDFQPIYSNPLTMGTRCHQLAMYVIHDSPLTMLADSPSAYKKEPGFTHFMASIPTVWDDTKVISGKTGNYIVVARRKGNVWYIGGQTNWESRDLSIDLSALGLPTTVKAEIYSDGKNADKNGSDYERSEQTISEGSLNMHLASGGGFVIKVRQ